VTLYLRNKYDLTNIKKFANNKPEIVNKKIFKLINIYASAVSFYGELILYKLLL